VSPVAGLFGVIHGSGHQALAVNWLSSRCAQTPLNGLFEFRFEEATGGFEPPIAVLQTAALPLGYVAWSDETRNFTCTVGGHAVVAALAQRRGICVNSEAWRDLRWTCIVRLRV
jgi:hypothetical protein